MMKPRRVCNTPKCKIKGHDKTGWLFPLKGGPHNKVKFRLYEPLPRWLELDGSVYVKTSLPERKRWPIMYVYDEVRSNDSHSTRDSRTARTELIARAALFGPSIWYGWDRQGA